MANQNKEHILQYMLKRIAAGDKKVVAKTLEAFSGATSKSTVYNYLKELCDNNVIIKSGSFYELVKKDFEFCYQNDGSLGEDRIFTRDIEPLLLDNQINGFSNYTCGSHPSTWNFSYAHID